MLKNSFKKYGVEIKQEADLQWVGLNLLPRRPKRAYKNNKWFGRFRYTADFIYLDRKKGILIDIEIDEKHHFEHESKIRKDNRRNNIFLCSGWSVIRFKDSSVVEDSDKCALAVMKIIEQIECMHKSVHNQLVDLQ